MDLSAEKRLLKPYYKGANVKFLHYRYQDEFAIAHQLLSNTRDYALDNNDSSFYAQFTYFVGSLYSRQDETDSSIVYFEKSLQLSKDIGDRQVEAASVNAIAVTYANLDRDDLAINYYYKGLDIAESIEDSTQISTFYGNLANVYSRMGTGDSTLHYAEKAYAWAVELQQTGKRWQALNALTIGSYLTGNYQQALSYADQLTEEVTPTEEFGFLITSYLYRSKSLVALKRPNESLSYAAKSLALAKDFELATNQIDALEWLVELSKQTNDYEKALDYEGRRAVLQDSLSQADANARLDKLAQKYETQEKEEKIKTLKKIKNEQESRQRALNWLWISLGLLSAISVLYGYRLFKNRVEHEKYAKQKARNELLRAQLNPHFLFNALSSIQLFLIDKGQGSHALSYLSKFAKLMRRILENSRHEFVSLDAELSTLRHYLDLQKIRFDNRFDYRIEVETIDDSSEIMIPPMFAQPFIENSLEHGIMDLEDGLISVSFRQEGESLRFKVEDNGVGISKSFALKRDGHESMATRITQDRIDLLKKQLKKNISFIVKDKVGEKDEVIGTEVIFEMPIQFA